MSETSKNQKYLMWYKVKELFSSGFNKTQIGLSLGIHRQTGAKYLLMSESEFLSSSSYNRHYNHKIDSYEGFIVNQLVLTSKNRGFFSLIFNYFAPVLLAPAMRQLLKSFS